MDWHDVRLYLPKYLSPETETSLFKDLTMFPENIDSRMYTTLRDPEFLYQGDGVRDLMVVALPNRDAKRAPCLVLSNTCDVDPTNPRLFEPFVLYTPLIQLSRYTALLENNGISQHRIAGHVDSIKRQSVTQIFYLPGSNSLPESLVFFDRMISNQLDQIPTPLEEYRIFSLSQYGHYLLLYKMSIHFTRIAEGVDRAY